MLKISIVTVSCNTVDTIEQTISSVVNQTYENIEYIIIDGGSADGTVILFVNMRIKLPPIGLVNLIKGFMMQ